MTCYRIYTEHTSRGSIDRICNKYLDCYTVIETSGVWQGTSEKSLIIEIITGTDLTEQININKVCKEIKRVNNQDAVLLTCHSLDTFKLV